jgi:S-adenosylmethionine:tRNA ribosyltransferase-isomerase
MPNRTSDYDYPLPEDLIARYPLPRREDSRMMVLDRTAGTISHQRFSDFPSFVGQGDLVVLNDTKVIPARTYSDDDRIEFLFLEEVTSNTWKCLVKPGRKMRVGAVATVLGVAGRVLEILPDGERIVAFDAPIDLEKCGHLPLPPYLEREAEGLDADRYQTVYARERGAVAAPAAGLHFTPEILARVPHTFVTLHVGVGTFRPVQVELLSEHRMHSERYRLSVEAASAINSARRIIAIGTTTTRVLEARAAEGTPLIPGESATDIFIHPPYEFRVIDALLTNFHLPKSTLLMLVSAFAGREFVLSAYAEAVREKYRFYSYGDCMLIV